MMKNKYFTMIATREDSLKYPLYRRKIIYITDAESMCNDVGLKAGFNLLSLKLLANLMSKNNSLAYDLSLAKAIFEFPPDHPQIDNFYMMHDLFPNKYFPKKDFNKYSNELKQTSFIKLCEDLGARKVSIENIIKNEKESKAGTNVPIPIDEDNKINADIKAVKKIANETNLKFEIEFNEKNKGIKKYDSPWLDTEPTWKQMCEEREKDIIKSGVPYYVCSTYNESNSVEIEGGLEKILKFFGKDSENYKIQVTYKVIFW